MPVQPVLEFACRAGHCDKASEDNACVVSENSRSLLVMEYTLNQTLHHLPDPFIIEGMRLHSEMRQTCSTLLYDGLRNPGFPTCDADVIQQGVCKNMPGHDIAKKRKPHSDATIGFGRAEHRELTLGPQTTGAKSRKWHALGFRGWVRQTS